MTVPSGEYATDDTAEADAETYDAINVVVTNELSHKPAIRPEYGALGTVQVPQYGAAGSMPVPVLSRRPGRHRAVLVAGGLAVTGGATLNAGGAFVAPAAPGTVISTLGVPVAGTYSITVNTDTVAGVAADHNNMALFVNGVQVAILPVAITGGTNVQSPPVSLTLPVNAVVTVQQIAVTTATGYAAIIEATPLTGSAETIVLARRIDDLAFSNSPNAPFGFTLTSNGQQLVIENQQPVYAIAMGGNAIVSVLDEIWET